MKRLRLHRSTYAVALLTAILFTALNIPGEVVDACWKPVAGAGKWLVGYEHGWPWIYQRRAAAYAASSAALPLSQPHPGRAVWGLPWLDGLAWQFWRAERRELWNAAAVGNAAFALASTVGLSALWEWRRRRRSVALRFGLRALALPTVLATIPLTWWVTTTREIRRERQAISQSGPLPFYHDESDCTPRWLKRLIGKSLIGDGLWRTTSIRVNGNWDPGVGLPLLRGLGGIDTISIFRTEEPSPILEDLSEIQGVQRIQSWVPLRAEDVSAIAKFTELKELRLLKDDLDNEELVRLIHTTLPRCRLLECDDHVDDPTRWFACWAEEVPW